MSGFGVRSMAFGRIDFTRYPSDMEHLSHMSLITTNLRSIESASDIIIIHVLCFK